MRAGERPTFLRNAASSYGQRALLGLSALLLTPYLFRGLGVAGFGTWSVMFTLTTIFTMLEVGFSAGATKYVAEFKSRSQRAELDSVVGAAVTLMAALGLVSLAACAVIGLAASGLAADDQAGDFRTGMLVLGAALALRFPFIAHAAALQGYQRYDAYNLAQGLTIVGFAIGAVVAVETGGGVLEVAVAYGAAQAAGGLLYLPLLRRIDPGVRVLPRAGDGASLRRVLSFSTFTLLADAMIFLGVRLDTVVIAAIRGAAAAAPFAAASKLQNGLQAPTLPVINLMMPMVAELHARGRLAEVRRRLVLAVRVTLQVTAPLAVGAALFSSDIVRVWLGDTAPAVTDEIVAILAVQTVMISAVPADKVLVGLGRPRTVGLLNMGEGLSNLAISIALVSAHGAIGAALGTLITSFAIGPAKFPLACRAAGCRLGTLLGAGIGRGLASALPGVAVMVPVFLAMDPGPARLALGLGLGVAVSALVAVLQVGPGRLRETLAGLPGRGAEPEVDVETSQLVAQGPS